MSGPPITPQQAKVVWDALPRQTLPALARDLAVRGTPVSINTFRFWKRRGWNVATRAGTRSAGAAVDQARAAVRKVGLPAETIRDLETRLEAMSDGELIVRVTRDLLINSALPMAQAKALAPQLMKKDAHGLAAVYAAAFKMTEGAHELMAQARNLAERAMKEKCGLLLGPAAGEEPVKQQPPRPRPFAGLLERFGAMKMPAAEADDVVEGEAVEIVHPGTKAVN